jgi:hypothetical protein
MRYVLLVSFPLNILTLKEETDRVIELVGRKPTGSGAGFGMRDVDFDFDTSEERAAARQRLTASGGNYTISQYDDVQ